jgi:hypothetical protein
MPGLVDRIMAAVAGDPEAEHRLEAIIASADPPTAAVQ